MAVIELSIRNWDKFNPRRDIKRPTWFAMSNTILTDPDLYDFTGDELKAFVYIMSEASRKTSADIKVNSDHAQQICKIPESAMFSAIEKLIERNVIVCVRNPNVCVRARTDDETDPFATDRQTDTQTNTHTTANAVTTLAVKDPPRQVAMPVPISKEVSFSTEEDLIQGLPEKTLNRWKNLYPDPEFLRREVIKAFAWCERNPQRKPRKLKGWIQFLSTWFDKGWPQHQKSIAANPQGLRSISDILADGSNFAGDPA